MKALILGGTTGMGRAVARLLADRKAPIVLMGLPPAELEKSAADLAARGAPGPVGTVPLDLMAPDTFAAALDAADALIGGFDTVIVTAGMFRTQEGAEQDLEFTRQMLLVNYAHLVLFCEHVRTRLLARGGGTLAVFSSVAGDRGRKPVGLYGSSKAGLSHYLESLDVRHRAAGLRVLTVKPGFVHTGMTTGLKAPPFAGQPEQVARDVVAAIDAGSAVLYTPWPWRWVMLVIRHLPRFVMRRVSF